MRPFQAARWSVGRPRISSLSTIGCSSSCHLPSAANVQLSILAGVSLSSAFFLPAFASEAQSRDRFRTTTERKSSRYLLSRASRSAVRLLPMAMGKPLSSFDRPPVHLLMFLPVQELLGRCRESGMLQTRPRHQFTVVQRVIRCVSGTDRDLLPRAWGY